MEEVEGMSKKKRAGLKRQLTNLKKFADSISSEIKLEIVKVKIDRLNEVYTELNNSRCEFSEEDSKYYDDIDEEYDYAKGMLYSYLKPIKIEQTAIQADLKSTRLPIIGLETFSGEIEDFPPFLANFQSLIGKRNLSDVDKLHYLKSCLKEDALKLINSYPLTDENYNLALNALRARYENKRILISNCFNKLLQEEAVVKENGKKLKSLMDNFKIYEQSLYQQATKEQLWNYMLVHLLETKLDQVTRKEWERKTNPKEMSEITALFEFLELKCQSLEVIAQQKGTVNASSSTQKPIIAHRRPTVAAATAVEDHQSSNTDKMNNFNCWFCKGSHRLSLCSKFELLSSKERLEFVKENKLCLNCLNFGHRVKHCRFKNFCLHCKNKHNTLLHLVSDRKANTSESTVCKPETPSVSVNIGLVNDCVECNTVEPERPAVNAHWSSANNCVILPTALVLIKDNYNNVFPGRALLDCCSESNFISERLVNTLKMKRQAGRVKIIGVGQSSCGKSKGLVQVNILSKDHSFNKLIDALVVDKVTNKLPKMSVNMNKINVKLELADPNFGISSEIDLLLGVGVTAEVFIDGKINNVMGNLVAQNSKFGYVIMGECSKNLPYLSTVANLTTLENLLKQFWELNEIDEKLNDNVESKRDELFCEQQFVNTHRRDPNGKFIVQLPLCSPSNSLGDSFSIAHKRFLLLERRLAKNLDLYRKYQNFIEEYIELGHAKFVDTIDKENRYFIPHHCVIREESKSTKLRVVFDASCKSSSGSSLNDILYTGKKLQNDLFSILLRFRQYKFVFMADVEKMFRMVWIDESQQPYQSILWRNNNKLPLRIIQLKTVTYGLKCSPFLANRVLLEILIDEPNLYRDFYVDDFLSGADTLEEASNIQDKIINKLSSGGMHLSKWASNCTQLLNHLPLSELLIGERVISDDENVKTLGILWKPHSDYFSFSINLNSQEADSKRNVLSTIAKIFDPFGWLAPVTVVSKLFMQKLWSCKVDWDEEIPSELLSEWRCHVNSLRLLSEIKIPRYIFSHTVELHGFCDASSRAYAAVIYIKHLNENSKDKCNILCARTKAAPTKNTLTIPRLELCAAQLLAKLVKFVLNSLTCNISSISAWSDSTVVLSWIMNDPSIYKLFVANRVRFIQSVIPKSAWFHVTSEENPADCASRGIGTEKLLKLDIWWHGPAWLVNDELPVDQFIKSTHEDTFEEKIRKKLALFTSSEGNELLNKYSSYSKLINVVGWINRFIVNCKSKILSERTFTGFLSVKERNQSLNRIIRIVQGECFSDIFDQLKTNGEVKRNSNLRKLAPFIDEIGLIRVGGRLKFSEFRYDKKYPLLLPKTSHFCDLLIKYYHIIHLHAGPQLTLALLREKFWIVNGRNSIRRIIHTCNICFRYSARSEKQIMADLPKFRLENIRPFYKVGIDYAGPFIIKASKYRSNKTLKAYICIFVCLEVKAVHIELVSELTTNAFLAALRRFISRRSKPVFILSDRGTNFIGAAKELGRFLDSLERDPKHNGFVKETGIEWRFNPPRAPHFGGIWESAVKSAKHHLKRVVCDKLLDFEEFYTLLTQIESCLNSRPLSALSNDPNDFQPLTPGHFLTGGPLERMPEPDLSDILLTSLKRWKLIQHYLQGFWSRWKVEYVHELQLRAKWFFKTRNIQVGDLVLIKDDDVPPNNWPLGRVSEVFAGQDGLVRSVNIKTKTMMVKRPIVKIVYLPYTD